MSEKETVLNSIQSDVQAHGVTFKEITLQRVAYFQQQLGIDALSVENLIDIGAVAVQFLGQPHNRPLLASQLVFNLFSNKNLLHKIKKAEPTVTYLPSEAPPSALSTKISTISPRLYLTDIEAGSQIIVSFPGTVSAFFWRFPDK